MTENPHFSTPEDAEQAFYEALANGDADALMATWAEDEEIMCVHPTGVRLLGLDLIRESWRRIFSSTRLKVQPEPVTHWHGMLLAIHHLVETLYVDGDPAPHGPLHVTHIYSRGARGWRLVGRHASAASEATVATEETTPRVLH